jgi:D-alanine-D-alanine ligase
VASADVETSLEKTRVVLLIGGANSDNHRSCRQFNDVLAALTDRNFDVGAIGITLEGSWVLFEDLNAISQASRIESFELSDASVKEIKGATTTDFPPRALISYDIVFSLILGVPGADGRIAGLLESIGVRLVASDSLGSAIASDKSTIKLLLKAEDVATPRHVVIPDKAWRRDALSNVVRAASLKLPLIIKPCRSTNGLGISIVRFPREMKDAIAIARRFDGRFLAEEYHEGGRYLECGILEDSERRNFISAIVETKVVDDGIFNYLTRVAPDRFSQEVVSDLPEEIINKIKEITEKVFEASKTSGYLQVEFLLTRENELLFIEANPSPYLGKDGSFVRGWLAAGLEYEDIIYAPVMEAIRRPLGLV